MIHEPLSEAEALSESNKANVIVSSCRRPVHKHIVVEEGEWYSSIFNDTKVIEEEINVNYTVELTSDDLLI